MAKTALSAANHAGRWLVAYCEYIAPLLMPSHGLGSLSASWLILDRLALGASGIYAFLTEVYDYAVLPDKLIFTTGKC